VVAAQVGTEPKPFTFHLDGGVQFWVVGMEPRQHVYHWEFFFHDLILSNETSV
jgi:hypothetical protein